MDKDERKKRSEATDVNYNGIILCKVKGCPNEALEFSKYCDECYDEKYPQPGIRPEAVSPNS